MYANEEEIFVFYDAFGINDYADVLLGRRPV